MSRMIHADESAFSLCQDTLLHTDAPFDDGGHIDELLKEARTTFQLLCKLDSRYSELGCEFGYIHYKHDSPGGAGKMYFYLPQQGRKRPRRYVGVDPIRQFEMRAKLQRYEARTALRLRFAEMYAQYSGLLASLQELLASARALRAQAGDYLPEAAQAQQELEMQHSDTLERLKRR